MYVCTLCINLNKNAVHVLRTFKGPHRSDAQQRPHTANNTALLIPISFNEEQSATCTKSNIF